MSLMRSPAELGRLRAFADKPVDRPGVDELAGVLGDCRHLRVSFGDVNDLDAQALGETSPFDPPGWARAAHSCLARNIDQGLLDKMRDKTGVGTVRQYCSRSARITGAQSQCALAKGVIRSRRRRQVRIGITPRPRLYAS